MFKLKFNKGIALFMTLATILVIVVLTSVILAIISSQSRFTHHQVNRIRAYYAGRAGINYTLEMLRTSSAGWGPPTGSTPITKTICPAPSGCDVPNSGLPYTVTINIWPVGSDPDGSGPILALPGVAAVIATATYTYP